MMLNKILIDVIEMIVIRTKDYNSYLILQKIIPKLNNFQIKSRILGKKKLCFYNNKSNLYLIILILDSLTLYNSHSEYYVIHNSISCYDPNKPRGQHIVFERNQIKYKHRSFGKPTITKHDERHDFYSLCDVRAIKGLPNRVSISERNYSKRELGEFHNICMCVLKSFKNDLSYANTAIYWNDLYLIYNDGTRIYKCTLIKGEIRKLISIFDYIK